MGALKNTAQYAEIQYDIGTSPAEIMDDDKAVLPSVILGGFKVQASVTYLKNLKKFLAQQESPEI